MCVSSKRAYSCANDNRESINFYRICIFLLPAIHVVSVEDDIKLLKYHTTTTCTFVYLKSCWNVFCFLRDPSLPTPQNSFAFFFNFIYLFTFFFTCRGEEDKNHYDRLLNYWVAVVKSFKSRTTRIW